MPNVIEAGRVFVREGTVMPETLPLESEPYTRGWRSVKSLDGYALGQKIHDAGWTFFFLAGETKATVFGIDEEKMARRAIERILANRVPEKFNSLQIMRVASSASKRFLGIRHVTVCAQSRHIQESAFIFQGKDAGFAGALPSGMDLSPDPRMGLSTGKELALDGVKTPDLESVRI